MFFFKKITKLPVIPVFIDRVEPVRKQEAESRDPWHYINYPFKPAGEPDSVKTFPPDPENIEKAFDLNLAILKDKTRSNADKAKALCWIFHLAGDAHQPLHTTALFSSLFDSPKGDRGGTLFYVRVTPGGGTTSLHSLWDGAVIGSDNFQSVKNEAVRPRSAYKRADLAKTSEKDFKKWVQESFALAKTVVYRNRTLKGSKDRNDGEVLPADYRDAMKETAEKRVTFTGYRLADLLKRKF
jgi:hypothetical protein